MSQTSQNYETVAKANPGVQHLAMLCPVFDLLYGGARGGGKSVFLILDWLSHATRCGGKARGLVLRRTRKQLADIIETATPIFMKLGWEMNRSDNTCRGPDGSLLTFAYLDNDADAENYQGWNLSWLGIDEGGNFPKSTPIDKLYATLRVPGVEHKFRITANPGGPGHQWLRERYIKPALPFKAHKAESGIERIYIPAKLSDNPYTNTPEYIQQLKSSGPDWLVKAWVDGDWDVIPGGGVIDPDKIKDAKPPENMTRRLIGADLAFTEDTRNDESAFLELGKWSPGDDAPVQYHITHVDHGHYTISDSVRKVFDLHDARRVRSFRIEGGPSGRALDPFVRERMRAEGVLLDFQLVSHMRDKVSKAVPFASAVGMGLVYADKSASWWPAFRDECLIFDGEDGKSDNMVDAASVAFGEIDMLYNNEPLAPVAPVPHPRSMAVRDAYIKRQAEARKSAGPRLMWR